MLDIAARLEGAGYETWCVGGAVRDALAWASRTADWDLATAATPDQVMQLFRRRTIPVGVSHGTVGVLDAAGAMHEVTTFRRDVRTDGRHADVEFGASLDEDLARRDFTINAIAYSPSRHLLHDPFDGRGDLGAECLRAVGDAGRSDARGPAAGAAGAAVRGRFEFAIDPATWDAIVASAPYLRQLSAERVKEELTKTMTQVAKPSAALRMWHDCGALAVLVPRLDALDAVTVASLDCLPQPGRPIGGDTPAAQRSIARSDARRLARLAAMFLAMPAGQRPPHPQGHAILQRGRGLDRRSRGGVAVRRSRHGTRAHVRRRRTGWPDPPVGGGGWPDARRLAAADWVRTVERAARHGRVRAVGGVRARAVSPRRPQRVSRRGGSRGPRRRWR